MLNAATLIVTIFLLLIAPTLGNAQTVLEDNFTRANSNTVGGGWTEIETVASGAQILSNSLQLGSTTPGREWVYKDFNGTYQTTLSSASGVLTWAFNMRTPNTNPSGFDNSNYGLAYIIGSTANTVSTGNGYAVVLGQSGTTDAIRLVRFTGGFDLNSDLTDIISGGDYGSEYLSIRVTYNPTGNNWSLFVESNASAFPQSDPRNTATQIGSTTSNATYTGSNLRYGGPFWNHAAGVVASNNGTFDDIYRPASTIAVNGAIGTNEYGNHTNGNNQQSTGTGTWYSNHDASNLYFGVDGGNINEAAVVYLDYNPIVPVNGGTNANGNLSGYNNYDGSSFANLQFRADLVLYFKNGYAEYRLANGSGGWGSAVTTGISNAASGTVREFSIPWSALGGMPASYNWFGYIAYSGGGAYASVPTENPGSGGGTIIGASARWPRYYTVSTTTIGSATPPFSRNSYTFTEAASNNSFGAISVWDFTMNTSGLQIARLNTGGDWTIGNSLVVGDGTVFFGSGGSGYGQSTIANIDIRGGSLNMDQTNKVLNCTNNFVMSSGSFFLSGTSGGDLNLAGNWTLSGGTFTPNNRAVTFNGTAAQSITGATTFDYLTINNTSGLSPAITANNALTVNQTLTLTSGRLRLGTNNLTVANTAPGAVSGGSSTAFIETNSTGLMIRSIPTSSLGTYSFPVGLGASYSPVSYTFSANNTARNLQVRAISGTHPQMNNPTVPPNYTANRYWETSLSTSTGTYTYTAQYNFVAGDANGTLGSIKLSRWNGAAWTEDASSSTAGTTISSGTLTETTGSLAATAQWTGRNAPAGPSTYAWNATSGSADWTVAASWTPARNTPDPGDVLTFPNGGSSTATNVPTETVARLVMSNNTAIILQAGASGNVLSVDGGTGTDLDIPAGSAMTIGNGANALSLNFNNTGNVATLAGTLTVSNANTSNSYDATNSVSTVSGTFNNGGVVSTASAADLVFNSGSTYNHIHTAIGGTIPTATWNSGSTTAMIGYTSPASSPSGLNQTFHHFLYNCTSQTGVVNLNLSGAVTMDCNGNFTVQSTGSSRLMFNDVNSNYFLTVNGAFNFTGGNLDFAGLGGGSLFLNGTFTQSSTGTLELKRSNGGGNVTIYLVGNFTHSAGTMTKTSTDNPGATWNFSSSAATQVINQSGGTYSGTTPLNVVFGSFGATIIRFDSDFNLGSATGSATVSNAVTLNFQTNRILSAGSFIAASGSILRTANVDAGGALTVAAASGSVRTSTRTYQSGVNYYFSGAAAQVAGDALGANTTGNITIDNLSGVSLNASATMGTSSVLALTNGRLNLGAYNLTLGTSGTITGTLNATNMVVAEGAGELRKSFSAAGSFTFPVGDITGTAEYSPVTLNFTSGTFSSAYAGVRLVDAVHPSNSSATDYLTRYWNVSTSGITAFSCTYSATYLNADITGTEANLYGGLRNAGNTAWVCQNAVNAASNLVTNTLSDFEGGAITAGESAVMGCGTPSVAIYAHNFGTSTISTHPYTVSPTATPTPGILAANLSNSSWSNGGSTWTSFAGSAGQAIASSSISSSNPWTLTFDVASGYAVDIASFSFWRQSSQATNTWSMTINGISVGSGTIPTSGTNTGSLTVTNPVSGLTGTVTVVITFGGTLTGSMRIDDFTLVGNVSSLGTITTGTVSGSPYCAGVIGVNVPFTYTPAGNFPNGVATFTAQLSDASGSFASPTNLQSVGSNASGSQSINVTIPSGTVTGTGYRIRVVSASPTVNGSDNGANLTINNPSTTVSPSATQSILTGVNGSTLTVNEGYTVSSRQWKYSTVSGGPYSTNLGTASTQIPNFGTPGTYYIVCESTYGAPCSVTNTSNEIQITVSNPAPEINLVGNGLTIVDGDASPSLTDHTNFGSVAWGNSFTRTFTIQNTGTGSLNLSGASPYVVIGGAQASDYSITTPPSNTVAPGASTTFVVTFSPAAIGTRNATLTINNDDSDEGVYDFAITGTGTPSNLSTIEFYSPFTTPQNIDYLSYQETNLTNASLSVMEFRIMDGGPTNTDADNLGTTLNAVTLNLTNWSFIRRIALYWGSTEIAEQAVSGSTVSFTGLTGASVTAADNSSRILTVKVSFNTTVTDNAQFSMNLSDATVTALSTGSAFTTFGTVSSETTTDRNRIEVVADRLRFGTQPANGSVNVNLAPFTVRFEDVNGNLDFDTNRSVSLSTSGVNMSPATPTGTLTAPHSGIISFGSVLFTTGPQTAITLTATTTGLSNDNDDVSNPFDITDFVYLAGDYRPNYAGSDFSFNGGWDSFNGTTWTLGVTAPQNLPTGSANRPARIIIDKPFITGGGNTLQTYNDIIILNGGELTFQDDDNPPVAAELLFASKKIEVLSGGILHIEGDIDLPTTASLIVRSGGEMIINQASMVNNHPMWDGVELFEGGSTLTLNTIDWTASAGTASLINQNPSMNISSNANGYKFGNIIIDANIPGNWNFIGGSTGIVNLAENDVDINNTNATSWVTGHVNASGTNGFVINGNLTVYDGNFAFGSSYSNTAFNQQFTVNGNVEIASNDGLKLHYNGLGTPTTLSGSVTVLGDFIVGSGVTSFTNDGGSGSPARIGLIMRGGTLLDPNILDVAPVAVAVPMTIGNGTAATFVKLRTQDLVVNSVTSYTAPFTVTTNAQLDFGFNAGFTAALNYRKTTTSPAGTNTFTSNQGSTLVITSPNGIWDSGTTTVGNVQESPSNISYDQLATFWYKGRANQVTGDGLATGSSGKVVIVELNTLATTLTLTNGTGITNATTIDPAGGKLEIREGTLISGATSPVSSTGRLIMTGGIYRIAELTTCPQLDGAYTLTAGTIDLNGAGDQILRGTRDYASLMFSTSGTKTLSSALPAGSLTDLVTVQDAAILDVANNNFDGTSALNMTGTSRFRMSSLSTTLPQLTGTYTLTGGTVELYGTGAGQTHSLRGTVTYNNVELNATAASVGLGQANVVASAGFGLRGAMTVQSPTCFQLGSGFTITDAGTSSFVLAAGSTLKYGGTIAATGASGNIQTDTRTFPTTASYGFVGSVNPQTVGTGLPATMVNLYMDKDAGTSSVQLSQNTTVSNNLVLGSGILDAQTNIVSISNTATSAVSGFSASSFVSGKLNRLLPSSLASGSSYDYPVGQVSGPTYLPATLVNPTTGTGVIAVRMEAFTTGSGGTPDPNSLSSLSNTEYWSLVSTGNFTNSQFSFARPTAIAPNNAMGRSTTVGGTYVYIGGTPVANGINNTNASAGNAQFFAFGVTAADPTITSVVPTSPVFSGQADNTGYVGQTLTITGTGFTSTAGMSVSIGGLAATTFTVVNSTTITAVVAQNASGNTVVVTNTVTSGSASAGFTFLGWISNASTDWSLNATWLGGQVPPASVDVTIAHAVTANGSVSNSPNTLTIRSTNSLTFGAAGALTVNNTLTNNGSIVMTAGGTLTMGNASTFNNGTATFTGGTGTVVFAGTGTVVTTGGVAFNNVTLNGSVNAGAGSSVAGTLRVNEGGSLNTNAITYGAAATLLYNGTSNQTVGTFEWPAGSSPLNFTANNPSTVILGFSRSIAGNVRIQTGTFRSSGAASLTMTGAAATFEVSGTLLGTDAGVGNDLSLIVDGTTTVNGSNATTCKLFTATVNTGATLALARNNVEVRYGSFNVNGTGILRIDANGNVASVDGNSRVPVYAATAGLVYNSGGAYGRFVEWSTLSGPAGYPGYVTVQNGTTLNIGTPSTDLGIAGDLNLGQTGSAGSLNMGSTAQGITVNGSVNIGSNTGTSTLTLSTNALSPAIRVGGSWTRTANGSFVGTGANGRGVFFIGGTNGSISAPTTETFEFLLMQKSVGSDITLNQNVSVNQTLTFNTGTFTLGAFNLGANTISGGSTNSFAITNSTGYLRRTVNNVASSFPVGTTASTYAPASLTQQGTAEVLGVRVRTAPAFTAALNNNAEMVNLEWFIDESTGTAGANSLVTNFTWPGSSNAGSLNIAAALYHGNYNGTNWQVRPTLATTGSDPYTSQSTANYTGTLSARNFVVGNLTGILGCQSTAINGSWNNGSTWTDGFVPPLGANVCINHSVTVGLADPNPDAVTGMTLSGAGTLTLDASKTITFLTGGALANNTAAALNFGAGTVVTNGVMGISGTNPVSLSNLTLNGNTTISTVPTITGNLQLNSGASLTAAVIYGAASTLVYNTGAAYNVSNEWTGTGAAGLGVPANVTITGTTLNMPTSNRGLAGNMTISAGALNLNGTSGDLYVGGNWTRSNTASFNANNRAVFFNGGSNQTIAVTGGGTETFAYVLVNKVAGSLILSASPATDVNINANSGNVLDIGNNNTIDLNGRTLNLSGTSGNLNLAGGTATVTGTVGSVLAINNGTKTITPNGGATAQFGSNVTIALSSGLNFGSNVTTVNGTLQIAAGGFVQTNAPTYAAGSILRYFTGNSFNRGTEWSSNSGPGYPFNVTLDQNGTVTTVNLAPGAASCQIAGNLTINDGAVVNMGAMTTPLNVRGNVNIGGAASGTLTLSSGAGGDLMVGGNLSLNSGGTFTQASREVIMNGSATQNIFNITNFGYLAIDNSGADVLINANTTVSNRLRLQTGQFNLNGYTATMANNSMIMRVNGTMSAAPSLVGSDVYDMRYDASVSTSVEYLNGTTQVRDLIVSSGVSLTLNGNRTFNRNLDLSGNIDLGGFVLTARGRVTAPSFSGSINLYGGGTRLITGAAGSQFNITGLGANNPLEYTKTFGTFAGTTLNFDSNVLVAIGDGAVDFGTGNPVTINGVLQVMLGGSVGQVLNPCVFGTNSILRFANTVDYQVGVNDKTWASGAINSGAAGIPWNVEVNDAGTDLQLLDTRALRGNLTITNGTFTLTPTFTGSFNIGGNWTRTGASSVFTHNNKKVTFDRQIAGDQTITTGGTITGETFYDLEVSPASGNLNVAASTALTVRGNLNFATGKLNIGSNNLTIGTSTAYGSVTGFTSSKYVVSTGGSMIHFTTANSVTYAFPLGDATKFTPFELNLDNGGQAGSFITTTVNGSAHPNIGTATSYITRYWSVVPTGLAINPVYDVVYSYDPADVVGVETTFRPVKYSTATASPGWISSPGSGAFAIDGTASIFDVPTKTFSWDNLTTFSEFSAAGDGSPLPVTLLSFDAEVVGNAVLLSWNTASEINNDYFTIERSADASHFEKVGVVDGAGNSSLNHYYSLKDMQPLPGVSYYRLSQTDFNGTTEVFDPVPVSFSSSLSGSASLYPNPATQNTYLALNSLKEGKGWVRITDLSGRVLSQEQIVVAEGTRLFTLNLRDLAAGQYIVTVNSADGQVYNLPLVRQH
jgi:hypothetical protein